MQDTSPAQAEQTGSSAQLSLLEAGAEQLASFAISLVGVILLLAVAWFVAGFARRALRRGLERAKFDVTLGMFAANMLRWFILLMALMACLEVFGIKTTSFAAVLGAAALAIGLGFQGSLSNLAAGVMLLVFRPFKVGDMVNVAGQLGKVNEIDLFMTEIDTPDGRRVILPNGQIFGNTIENITHHPRRRVDIPVGVAYDADIDRTRQVLEAAVRGVTPRLDDPAPEVFLNELGASSVNWTLRVWTRREDFGATRQATVRAAKVALDEAGIGIPFPQMDVHLRLPEGGVLVGSTAAAAAARAEPNAGAPV